MGDFNRAAFADDGRWLVIRYECEECDRTWTDRWTCAVDDDCDGCGVSTQGEIIDDVTAEVIENEPELAKLVKLDDSDPRRFELAVLHALPDTDAYIMCEAVVSLLTAGEDAAFYARAGGELFYGETEAAALSEARAFALEAGLDPEDIPVHPIATEAPNA